MSHFKNSLIQSVREKLNLFVLGPRPWLILLFLTVFVNQRKYWADSEMWAVAATRDFFAGKPEFYFAVKPLFHFILWLNFRISEFFSVFPMDLARLIWSLIAVSLLYSVSYYLKIKGASKWSRTLSVLLVISVSTWVFRSGEVRSDVLTSLIAIVSLICIVKVESLFSKFVILILGSIFSILVTPKAGLLWLSLSPLFIAEFSDEKVRISRSLIFKVSISLILVFSVFLVLAYEPLQIGLQYFLSQMNYQEMGFLYFSTIRLHHIQRLILQNPHFTLFVVFAVLLAAFVERNIFLRLRYWLSLTLVLIFIFAYTDPLPFFLASMIPFVALNLFMILDPLLKTYSERRMEILTYSAYALFVPLYFFWWGQLYLHHNFDQKELAIWAKANLEAPHLLVLDPTGFLATDNSVNWFLGPARREQNQAVLAWIEELSPEVILTTSKIHHIEAGLNPILQSSYIKVSTSIFLKAVQFNIQKPCSEVYNDVAKAFYRHHDQGAPVLLWGHALYDETFTKIEINEERICSFNRNAEMEYFFLPVELKRVPMVDLRELFAFDSRF